MLVTPEGQAGGRGSENEGVGQASVVAPPSHTFISLRLLQVQLTCACGKKYWPSQRWVHEGCGVVNHQETLTTATNGSVVVNRSKDRHSKTPERAQYMREYMRKRRAK